MDVDAPVGGRALLLAPGLFQTEKAKTAHGLVRGTDRFQVVGVLDAACAGRDAGEVLDGQPRGVPVFASLDDALASEAKPEVIIVGVAVPGGRLPAELRDVLRDAARRGMTCVNGLHELLEDDPEMVAAARASGGRLVDVRKPRPPRDLHFWTGAIDRVRAPRLALLGTDCALGKRTTARLLVEACQRSGLRAEMIYTGQTGWLQGGRWGFVLDSTPNDFVAGELEHAVVTCDREANPDVIILEGQSALRNPSGPCGAELLLSARARAAVLQHAPGRHTFKGHDEPVWAIPSVVDEIDLIRLYGARVLAVALNGERLSPAAAAAAQRDLTARMGLPVVRPLEEGVEALVPLVRAYVDEQRREAARR